jgi:hypothetical protein
MAAGGPRHRRPCLGAQKNGILFRPPVSSSPPLRPISLSPPLSPLKAALRNLFLMLPPPACQARRLWVLLCNGVRCRSACALARLLPLIRQSPRRPPSAWRRTAARARAPCG